MPRWIPTHWLHWSPADHSTSLSWAVRLIRDRDATGSHFAAITEDEFESGAEPCWIAREGGPWRWRGLRGYRGRVGTVTIRAIEGSKQTA